jgi:DNA-binding response OmpR family regulator
MSESGDGPGYAGPAVNQVDRRRPDGPVVLIVEDDVDLAEVLTAGLENRGAVIVVRNSWMAARMWCEERTPKVILLDLILPDGTGADLIAWLRDTGRMDGVAVVVYTALDVDSWHRIEMGVSKQDLFVKSQASPEVVVHRVLRLLHGARPDRTVATT